MCASPICPGGVPLAQQAALWPHSAFGPLIDQSSSRTLMCLISGQSRQRGREDVQLGPLALGGLVVLLLLHHPLFPPPLPLLPVTLIWSILVSHVLPRQSFSGTSPTTLPEEPHHQHQALSLPSHPHPILPLLLVLFHIGRPSCTPHCALAPIGPITRH